MHFAANRSGIHGKYVHATGGSFACAE